MDYKQAAEAFRLLTSEMQKDIKSLFDKETPIIAFENNTEIYLFPIHGVKVYQNDYDVYPL